MGITHHFKLFGSEKKPVRVETTYKTSWKGKTYCFILATSKLRWFESETSTDAVWRARWAEAVHASTGRLLSTTYNTSQEARIHSFPCCGPVPLGDSTLFTHMWQCSMLWARMHSGGHIQQSVSYIIRCPASFSVPEHYVRKPGNNQPLASCVSAITSDAASPWPASKVTLARYGKFASKASVLSPPEFTAQVTEQTYLKKHFSTETVWVNTKLAHCDRDIHRRRKSQQLVKHSKKALSTV